jgi:hypothetical protein
VLGTDQRDAWLLTRKVKQSPCLLACFNKTPNNLRHDAGNGDDGPVRYERRVVSAQNVEVTMCSKALETAKLQVLKSERVVMLI